MAKEIDKFNDKGGGKVINLFPRGEAEDHSQELAGVTFREQVRGMDMVLGSHYPAHLTLEYGESHGYRLDPGSICRCFLDFYENTIKSVAVLAENSAFYADQFRRVLMVLPEWQELLVAIERHNQLWLSLIAARFRLERQGKKRFEMEVVDGNLTITGDADQFDEDALALIEEEKDLSARNSKAINSLIKYGCFFAVGLFKGVEVDVILREIGSRTRGLAAVPSDSE